MVLRIGQRVPDFSLPDTNKQERKLSEFTQKGKMVLLFFPFAFSGVCDKEMCVFRDGAAKLNSLNAQTVGISVDSLFTLKVFATDLQPAVSALERLQQEGLQGL